MEVLRGPQGTLYGRNATGGAVDIITTQPSSQFGGYGSVQYGNYNQIKATGAVNIPLGDMFAVRIAGSRLVNDGFGENTYLGQRVDGRDLGAARVTLSFKPSDKFSAYLMYEHFGEDDTRNRVGKQLCIKDPGPTNVGGVPVAPAGGPVSSNYASYLNQGCLQGSLYQDAAYGTINTNATTGGLLANLTGLNNGLDLLRDNPLQDHNLHNIQSLIQPLYKVQEDLVDLHMTWNITDNLSLTSITGYNRDVESSAEDYNRVVSVDSFTPGVGIFGPLAGILFPGGVVNDPQTGPGNKLTGFDETTGSSKEYTEELRLTSSFKGPLNFSVGGFYSELTSPFMNGTNYYVESSGLTQYALVNNAAGLPAINVDPNYPPNGSGHNYYDSRTGGGYLKSYAAFGEVYYDILPNLKLTLGGRYTTDQLYNISYPIELLEVPGAGFPTTFCPAGTSSATTCLTQQHVTYREFTGRANLDYTPVLSFTDKTLIYATYSRGYKGGGFNTPCQIGDVGTNSGTCPYPASYNPEFINAYEVGTKNTLLGGSLQLNLTGFYYDYKDYQISEIVANSSVNLNINAKIYGVEFESVYSPIHNLTFNANVGYIHTRIDDGQSEVDQLNLNDGNANYTLVKDTAGHECLAPTASAATYIAGGFSRLWAKHGLRSDERLFTGHRGDHQPVSVRRADQHRREQAAQHPGLHGVGGRAVRVPDAGRLASDPSRRLLLAGQQLRPHLQRGERLLEAVSCGERDPDLRQPRPGRGSSALREERVQRPTHYRDLSHQRHLRPVPERVHARSPHLRRPADQALLGATIVDLRSRRSIALRRDSDLERPRDCGSHATPPPLFALCFALSA